MDALTLIILFLSSTLCFYFLLSIIRFLDKVWWTPIRLQATMRSQGIRGPSYSFPHGNTKEISNMRRKSMSKPMDISHDILPRVQPHVYTWTKIYGPNFLIWHGSQAQFFVTEPELAKEILMNRDGSFPKMELDGYAKKLIGEAIPTNEGEKWAKIRKLANHTFHAESLKSMVPDMSSSVAVMLERWKNHEGEDIDVFKEFELLTAEVLSRTAFGSSYLEGRHIFEMVAKLSEITVRNIYKVRFPVISMLLKSDDDVEVENLETKIKRSIAEIIKKRENAGDGVFENHGSDYLGQLVKISRELDPRKRITTKQMIDEIKAFYVAGYHTTANLLAWSILLLAINTEWQEKAREEVKETFGCEQPNSDGIARLRTMNMIINECLRLYPGALTLTRKVAKETKLGNLKLVPNMNIFISVFSMHHNPKIWGKDVHLFRPARFAEGVAKATNNNCAAFLPFGMGARTCVGLNFTINEAKIALCMILQQYKFVLSPNYVHNPAETFILTPKNGVQIILNAI